MFKKILFLVTYVFFIDSFFYDYTPNQLSSSKGEYVLNWRSPASEHIFLALEPLIRLVEHFTFKKDLYSRGDGDENYLRDNRNKGLVSIPVAIAWWGFLLLPFYYLKKLPFENKISRKIKAKIAYLLGFIYLIAVIIQGYRYYSDATRYVGYFHLRPGAYLILASFFLMAISLFKVKSSNNNL